MLDLLTLRKWCSILYRLCLDRDNYVHSSRSSDGCPHRIRPRPAFDTALRRAQHRRRAPYWDAKRAHVGEGLLYLGLVLAVQLAKGQRQARMRPAAVIRWPLARGLECIFVLADPAPQLISAGDIVVMRINDCHPFVRTDAPHWGCIYCGRTRRQDLPGQGGRIDQDRGRDIGRHLAHGLDLHHVKPARHKLGAQLLCGLRCIGDGLGLLCCCGLGRFDDGLLDAVFSCPLCESIGAGFVRLHCARILQRCGVLFFRATCPQCQGFTLGTAARSMAAARHGAAADRVGDGVLAIIATHTHQLSGQALDLLRCDDHKRLFASDCEAQGAQLLLTDAQRVRILAAFDLLAPQFHERSRPDGASLAHWRQLCRLCAATIERPVFAHGFQHRSQARPGVVQLETTRHAGQQVGKHDHCGACWAVVRIVGNFGCILHCALNSGIQCGGRCVARCGFDGAGFVHGVNSVERQIPSDCGCASVAHVLIM